MRMTPTVCKDNIIWRDARKILHDIQALDDHIQEWVSS